MFENLSNKARKVIRIGAVAVAGIAGGPPALEALDDNLTASRIENQNLHNQFLEYYRKNQPFYEEMEVDRDINKDIELRKKMDSKGLGPVSVITNFKDFAEKQIHNYDNKMTVRIGFKKDGMGPLYPLMYIGPLETAEEMDKKYSEYNQNIQKQFSIEVDWEIKSDKEALTKLVKQAILAELDK